MSAPTLDSCVVFGVIIVIEQHFPTNSPLQIQISDLDWNSPFAVEPVYKRPPLRHQQIVT